MLIANAILFPDRQIWLFPLPIKIPMRTIVTVMGAIEFFGTFGSSDDSVSHLCHLGGMLVGWLYLRRGSFLYSVRNAVSDWKYRRNRKRFEVYMKKNKNEPPPSQPDHWVNYPIHPCMDLPEGNLGKSAFRNQAQSPEPLLEERNRSLAI